MAINLYLFRHGESEGNARPEIIAGRNPELKLSTNGHLQAEALGERLFEEGFSPNEVYSSSAVRAMQTASIVCGYVTTKEIVPVEALLELYRGDWEGRLRAEVETPKVLVAKKADPLNFRPPRGESMKQCEQRQYAWLKRNVLLKTKPEEDKTVAIFGHGLATKCLLKKLFDFRPEVAYRINTDNCGITQLRYEYSGNRHGWSIIKINDNAHVSNSQPNPELAR